MQECYNLLCRNLNYFTHDNWPQGVQAFAASSSFLTPPCTHNAQVHIASSLTSHFAIFCQFCNDHNMIALRSFLSWCFTNAHQKLSQLFQLAASLGEIRSSSAEKPAPSSLLQLSPSGNCPSRLLGSRKQTGWCL